MTVPLTPGSAAEFVYAKWGPGASTTTLGTDKAKGNRKGKLLNLNLGRMV